MTKTALLFAGQGAQVVGMGKDLAAQFPAAKAWFDRANAALGYDLAAICFNGPDAELTKTENAQPGIFLVSWVAFQLLKERVPALEFQSAAGLSLGEFTALTAAGALSFEDGLRVVRQRGRFMQEACDATKGGMAAVIGLDEGPTREVCAEAGVVLANLNCPGQLVISGDADKIAKAVELAKAKGAKRAIPLPVAGAYHSPLMASAQPKLQNELASAKISSPAVPVISNVTAQPHSTPSAISARMVEQVTSSVRWEESMRYLLTQGFTRFIELGPGTALSGFMKRIDKTAQMFNVADADWDTVLNTNLKGAFLFTKAFTRAFVKQRSGRIINVASIIGLIGNAGQANYAASKAGLIGFTQSVARELASRGVTVNALAPGFVETDMTAVLNPELKAELLKRIPLNSFGQADDIANAALFLAGSGARYITGQVLTVDGGMVM